MEKKITKKTTLLSKNGIAQVALVIPDLDKAVEHYWNDFGIGPWTFYTYEKPFVKEMTYHGKSADQSFRVALANCGPMRIELIEAKKGDSVYADFIKKHGYGVQHLGIVVEDIHAAFAEAEDAGWKIVQDGSGFGADGDGHYAYLDTEDEIGVTLELIERPKRRQPPEKIYPAE
jgi:methylmalonyl-CoA epimerase